VVFCGYDQTDEFCVMDEYEETYVCEPNTNSGVCDSMWTEATCHDSISEAPVSLMNDADRTCLNYPTIEPTNTPTSAPSDVPSTSPTQKHSKSPTLHPTTVPTIDPTVIPTPAPTDMPTPLPTEVTQSPVNALTSSPSISPTKETMMPTNSPSKSPTNALTTDPSIDPTLNPSHAPSDVPSMMPTMSMTIAPSESPTGGKSGNVEVVVDEQNVDATTMRPVENSENSDGSGSKDDESSFMDTASINISVAVAVLVYCLATVLICALRKWRQRRKIYGETSQAIEKPNKVNAGSHREPGARAGVVGKGMDGDRDVVIKVDMSTWHASPILGVGINEGPKTPMLTPEIVTPSMESIFGPGPSEETNDVTLTTTDGYDGTDASVLELQKVKSTRL